MRPEAGTVGALAWQLCAWIDRLFPDADRGERLKRALAERFGDDARTVTGEVCREIEAVAHDFSRHFALEYVADGSLVPDTEPPGWPPQDPREVQLRAGSVSEVTRHPDGVGVLALGGLDGVHIAAPYLKAAFALLRGARGVVLDLRRNGGGDPGTVTLVLDWLLGGEPTHISEVIYQDRTRQWWTTGRLADLALPPETPVSVLVSERTFSSGEALAYHLQSRGRAQARRPADAGRRRSHHARARQQPRARVPAGGPRPRRRHRHQLGRHGRRARRPLRAGRGAGGGTRGAQTRLARGATGDGVEDEVEAAGESRVVVAGRAAPSGAPEGGVGVGLGLVKRLRERSPARRGGGRGLAAGAAEHVGEEEVVGVLRVVLVETSVLESVKDRVGEA